MQEERVVNTGLLRQGDVLLVPVSMDEIKLTGWEKKLRRHRGLKGLVLAEGEATGHHHRIVQKGPHTTARIRTATVTGSTGPVRVLMVPKGGAELVHDEHNTIKLPAGAFMVQGQREFVPPAPPTVATPTPQRSERRVWD